MARCGSAHRPPGDPIDATDPDIAIRSLAERQHGVVSRRQLLRAGVPGRAISYRVQTGRLRRLHQGVYLSGPVAPRYHLEMAAILACGARAVVSHTSAAALWELIGSRSGRRKVDVSGPRSLRGPRAGVLLHRVGAIPTEQIGWKHRVPVTLPARTLLDLAPGVAHSDLERIMARGERLQLFGSKDIADLLRQNPGRAGTPKLRAVLGALKGPAFVRSEAEARFLALVRKARIAAPETNVVVEGLEVDALWRQRRVVVEIDGFAYHGDRGAFEQDRYRDARLNAAGYRVLRFTWRQLTHEPEAMLVLLAGALASSHAPTR